MSIYALTTDKRKVAFHAEWGVSDGGRACFFTALNPTQCTGGLVIPEGYSRVVVVNQEVGTRHYVCARCALEILNMVSPEMSGV